MKKLICLVTLLIIANVTYGVTVDGFCYLEGETNHSGTKILFNAITPSGSTDSVFTSSDGSFDIGLSGGIYTVHYSHDGWQPYSLPGEVALFTDSTFTNVTLSTGLVQEVSGPQSGVWTTDYIYHVIGDISVSNSDSLTIQPGVTVKFMGDYSFDIHGKLIAEGTESDSILFTSGQTSTNPDDWKNIEFANYSDNNSIIAYAIIEYADDGLICYSSPTISNNLIIHNSDKGIYCLSSSAVPIIINNRISNNSCGIQCSSSSPTISNNKISNNSYGIGCSYSSSPTIKDNLICDNYNGINCSSSSPTIKNNSIYNNTNGISSAYYSSSSPTIINNNIFSNYYGINFDFSSPASIIINMNNIFNNDFGIRTRSQPEELTYNLFWSNNNLGSGSGIPSYFGEIVTVNANGDSCDAYYNIQMNPCFVDTANGNYYLTSNSPCIDAGDPTSPLDPDGTIADIGEFYFEQALQLHPTELHFGNVFIGNDSTFYVILKNQSDSVITVTNVSTNDAAFTTNWTRGGIQPDDSLVIDVTFTPNTTVSNSATLSIENSYINKTVSLSGNGLGAFISSDLYSLSFGAIEPGYPDTLSVELSNTGNIPLEIHTIQDAPGSYFNFVSITDSTIQVSETETLYVEFDPQVEGLFSDSLFILSNAYNEDTLSISLSGEGGLTPAPVENLIIDVDSVDAHLTWDAVTTTIHGNPLVVDCYIVYYGSSPDTVFGYLSYTLDTTYTHVGVTYFSDDMFYQVTAYVGDMPTLLMILDEYPAIKIGELEMLLKRKD